MVPWLLAPKARGGMCRTGNGEAKAALQENTKSWFGNEPCASTFLSPSLLPLTGALGVCTRSILGICPEKRATKYRSLARGAGVYPREATGGARGKPGEYLWICTFLYTSPAFALQHWGLPAPHPAFPNIQRCSSRWGWCKQGPTLTMERALPLGETAFAEEESPTPRVIVGLKTPREIPHQHCHHHLPISLLHLVTRKMF